MACQEGMCSEKPGTARGSPRRSRTAKASRISRCAVKSRCARAWGGWGRLSVDGRDTITRSRARTPGVVVNPLHGGARSGQRPGSERDNRCGSEVHEGWMQTSCRDADVGSRLKRSVSWEGPSESQPSSRTGENPPYGMIGGIEETSASFEARSAPRSYPTVVPGLLHQLDAHHLGAFVEHLE